MFSDAEIRRNVAREVLVFLFILVVVISIFILIGKFLVNFLGIPVGTVFDYLMITAIVTLIMMLLYQAFWPIKKDTDGGIHD